jgi:hypothetical protein
VCFDWEGLRRPGSEDTSDLMLGWKDEGGKLAEVGLGVGLGVGVELDEPQPLSRSRLEMPNLAVLKLSSQCALSGKSASRGGDGSPVANRLGGSEARRMLGIGSFSKAQGIGLGSGRTPHV